MNYLITNARIINENNGFTGNIRIENGKFAAIGDVEAHAGDTVIDANGKLAMPGVIDGQVHFRDPGLTHKADLRSESRAAVAGGTTSFIDMPNTKPNVLTPELLDEKYALAATKSIANFGFFPGVNGENVDEVITWDTSKYLAVSDDGLYFAGPGNLLADNPDTLEKLFANCDAIIAIHSELESMIVEKEEQFRAKYGDDVPVEFHPVIRSAEGCYLATKRAIELAQKHDARLHILHLTTARETPLFRNDIPLTEKKITTEVSVHHLWFTDADYARLGKKIKWNPAIKKQEDADGLLQALIDDRIDLITTDHAPHAWEEKDKPYFQSMSGAPMVQHSLNCMLEFHKQGKISVEKIVEKMCHNPATLYAMDRRGFIREGYYADLTLVDLDHEWTVAKDNLHYKCGWSPLEGTTFSTNITQTFVNGHLAFDEGRFDETQKGMALEVKR